MRIVLADLASADGFVSKDTVAGGYGSRLRPFSRVTHVMSAMKRHLHALHLARGGGQRLGSVGHRHDCHRHAGVARVPARRPRLLSGAPVSPRLRECRGQTPRFRRSKFQCEGRMRGV